MTTVKALMGSPRYRKFYMQQPPGPGMAVQVDGVIIGVIRYRTETIKETPRGPEMATRYYIVGEDDRPYQSYTSAGSVLVARYLRQQGELGGVN